MNGRITTKDRELLARAAELAFSCPPSEKAYSVGALITSPEGEIIGTGFSREWDGNWHAEEIAIEKARRTGSVLQGATIYSSMEPCHPRLSGKKSCTERIIESGIRRVVFCVKEPSYFVDCSGGEAMKKAGIEINQDTASLPRVRLANSHMPVDIISDCLAEKPGKP